MLPSPRQSTSVPELPMAYLVFAALAIQPCVVLAQSQSSNSYYYWLTPGRIVGIAIGGLALILLFISLLVLARRRCFHRRSPSRVAPSSSFTSGAVPMGAAARPPPAYPAWTGPPAIQQPIQTMTPFSGPGSGYGSGPGAVPGSGWHYPSSYLSPVPPYGHPKPIVSPSSDPAVPSARPGRAPSAASSRQGQGVAPPDRPTPSVQTHEQGQEQGTAPLPPPPRRHHPSYVTGPQSTSAGREESPPPYSPPGPQPPDAPTAT